MKIENNNQRGFWGSRLGFILAASGSAIGLGNVWKFPYIVGENGGGAFVLIYLLCIFIIGTPIMLAEFTLGRKTNLNPVGAFKLLQSSPTRVLQSLIDYFPSSHVESSMFRSQSLCKLTNNFMI